MADLYADVSQHLQAVLPDAVELKRRPCLWLAGGNLLNVRTAAEKAGAQYWFDVTPDYYEMELANFFLFACGSAAHIYVLPAGVLATYV